MRSARGRGGLAALLLACAAPVRAQIALAASIGSTFEDNLKAGDQELVRLSLPLTLGSGSPRSTQIEFEPAAAWHINAGTTDASGLGYTRLRAYHMLRLSHRFAIGPDIEIFFKTESQLSLGFGFTRFMPGLVAGGDLGHGLRTIVRARYEFSGSEDPGVKSLGRLTIRPTLYWPALGRATFWTRGDVIFDMHGAGNQYNVEGNASMRLDRGRRLTLFLQPRAYLGHNARASSLWRVRTGLSWSLGDLVVRRGPRESDLRRATIGESSPSKR